jgi:flagellar protein FlaG
MSGSELTNMTSTTPSVPATVPTVPATAVADHQNVQSADSVTLVPALPINSEVVSPAANSESQDQVKSAVVIANSMLQAANRSIHFQVDESTKKVVVKIVDTHTGKTIMQMPSTEMLSFTQNMIDHGGDKGSIIQQKA